MISLSSLFRTFNSHNRDFEKYYSADIPVDLNRIGEFRGDAFPKLQPSCWIDAPDALLKVSQQEAEGFLSASDAAMCRQFIVDGYYIAEGIIEDALLDEVWLSYEKAIEDGAITVPEERHGEGDSFLGRRLDPHLEIPHIRDIQWHPNVLRITDVLFGRKTVPFQTIMGHKGSQQRAHSDAIHMTTYPLGFLIANWIAFEDIHPDSGPLFYYPKSHRILPYLLSGDLGFKKRSFKNGDPVYPIYEDVIQQYIDAFGLSRQTFLPRKGDVLFWHSNLVHGAHARNDLRHSRKALVCHYFAERVLTYHDLSGNPTRLHKKGLYAPITVDPPSRNGTVGG